MSWWVMKPSRDWAAMRVSLGIERVVVVLNHGLTRDMNGF